MTPHRPSGTLLASAHERIQELDPSLSPDTPRYMAGVLLLALQNMPPRVDLLAMRLRLPREFVAKCMRRLIDNGVVQNGSLVGGWSGDLWNEDAFWADANVALGRWWRRQDGSGRLEWIEAGGWHKPYEYVHNGADAAVGTGYLSVAEAQPQMNLDLLTVTADSHWIGALTGDDEEYASEPEAAFHESPWVGELDGAATGDPEDAIEEAVVSTAGAASVVWLS